MQIIVVHLCLLYCKSIFQLAAKGILAKENYCFETGLTIFLHDVSLLKETMRIYAHLIFGLLCCALTYLLGCGGDDQYVIFVPGELPKFEAKDINGNQLADAEFRSGNTLLLILSDLQASLDVLAWTESFERHSGAETKKLIICADESAEDIADSWSIIDDGAVLQRFGSDFGESDLILFRDGGLVFSGVARALNRVNYTALLYHYFLGYNGITEIVESIRPENLIDVDAIYGVAKPYLGDAPKKVVFYVRQPFIKCDDKYLLDMLDKGALVSLRVSCLFVFDRSFNQLDIDLLRVNIGFLSPAVLEQEKMTGLFDELRDALFEVITNVALVFGRDGKLIDAFYVYADCDRLYSIL